jgi:hypothetical protein
MAEPFAWRDRIVEMRYVRPEELADHPLQHKIHGPMQQSVMRGVLQEVGIADVLRAYVSPTTSKLTAIDGHMRKHLGPQPWPTVILDVTDEEAAYLLMLYDEIAPLHEKDRGALDLLLQAVRSDDSAVNQLLADLKQSYHLEGPPPSLEHLAGTYREPSPDQFWPVVEVRVPPDIHLRYLTLLERLPGHDEAERFGALLGLAEAAEASGVGAS